MSLRIVAAVPRVRLGSELSSSNDAQFGSSRVATASRDGHGQQRLRADSTADALAAVGNSPRGAVATFAEADLSLARAF